MNDNEYTSCIPRHVPGISFSKVDHFQPCFSHMSHFDDRYASFENWPRHVRTKPEEFADAGFFYTGTGDRVRCFCCNGSFHNWKDSDRPWEVHAKWFPHCKYVLQEKGCRYVREIAKQHPNLNRIAPAVLPDLASCQDSVSSSGSLENEALNNNLYFDDNYKPLVNTCSSVFNSWVQSDTSQLTSSQVNHTYDNMNELSITTKDLDGYSNVIQSRLKTLKDEQTCKVCLNNTSNCLFLPCRHICCCIVCAEALRSCPICRRNIEKIIKVYRT